jgi:hypothetical protein
MEERMIPGSVSKLVEQSVASAATITAKADIVKVSGTTQINTIIPGLGTSHGQFLVSVPTDGAVTLGTSGNILVGIAAAQNRAVFLVFVKSLGKWLINSGV